MSQQAQLPDGTTLEFPDGTADGVIDKAVRDHLTTSGQLGNEGVGGKPMQSGPAYDLWQSIAEGAMLGQAPKIKAAAQATKQATEDIKSGVEPGEAFSRAFTTGDKSYYSQALDQYTGAEKRFKTENPVSSTAAEIGGSMIPTALGLKALDVGAKAALVPEAYKFISGGAGQGPGIANRLLRIASQGSAGALQGTEAAGITSPLSDKPLVDQLQTGAALGGGIGATLGPVANAASAMMRGKPITAETARAGQKLVDMGVPLKVGQLRGDAGVSSEQAGAFTRALSRTFGENAPALDAKVFGSARARIGGDFNSATAGMQIPFTDMQLHTDLHNARQAIDATALESGQKAALLKNVSNIEDNLLTGQITGKDYQDLTGWQSPLTSNMRNKDQAVRGIAGKIRDALDDAVERASPADKINQFQTARQQWKNMLIAEQVSKAKSSVGGVVDPSSILPKVAQRYSNLPSAGTPGSDIGDLAIGGRDFLRKGTEQGPLAKYGWKALLGADIAGGAGFGAFNYLTGHPGEAAATAVASSLPIVAGLIRRRIANSPETANRLIERTLNPQAARLGAPWAIPPVVAGANQQ